MIEMIDTIDTLSIIGKNDHDILHLLHKIPDIKIRIEMTHTRLPTIIRKDTVVIKVISQMNQTVMIIDKIQNNNNSNSLILLSLTNHIHKMTPKNLMDSIQMQIKNHKMQIVNTASIMNLVRHL